MLNSIFCDTMIILHDKSCKQATCHSGCNLSDSLSNHKFSKWVDLNLSVLTTVSAANFCMKLRKDGKFS